VALEQAWSFLKGQYPKDDPRIQAHIGAGTGTGINYHLPAYSAAKRLLQRYLENFRDYPDEMAELIGLYGEDGWLGYGFRDDYPPLGPRGIKVRTINGRVTNKVVDAFYSALGKLESSHRHKEWERVGGKQLDKDEEEGRYDHEYDEEDGDYHWDSEYYRKYEELQDKMVPYHESDAAKSDLKLLTDYHDEMSRVSADRGLGRGTWVSPHHPAMMEYTEQLNEQLGLHPEPIMVSRDVQSTSFDSRTQPDSQ
tara:strand:- start:10603 stop:11358 length:756 start_codon:yes stop_codon:yes gene_type:complete